MDGDEFRYAMSGNVAIAYAVYGEGPIDIVFVHGFAGNIEIERETYSRAFHDRISAFSRLVIFDRRGTGLSDRPREPATLEARMDDLRAVLDAVGSQHAVLFGTFEAASMCLLFAATYPERTAGLVLYNPVAKGTWAPDYPWAPTAEEWNRETLEEVVASWGTYAQAEGLVRNMAPTYADDRDFVAALARTLRLSASPGAAATIRRMAADVDVRDILGTIRVPTLVANMPAARGEAEYITAHVPGARRLEVPGQDFFVNLQADTLVPEIERFIHGLAGHEPDTVLATVLFTDIVGSTERLVELGDAGWRELVERHHALVRQQLARFRGEEVDTAGDGFFARFDGPIRAVHCAQAIVGAVQALGLEVRAGLHTGECELVGGKIAGLAVNIGARIAALADAGEVLVSSTVKDLVAGSELEFEDRGQATLKGVPGEWRLFASR